MSKYSLIGVDGNAFLCLESTISHFIQRDFQYLRGHLQKTTSTGGTAVIHGKVTHLTLIPQGNDLTVLTSYIDYNLSIWI